MRLILKFWISCFLCTWDAFYLSPDPLSHSRDSFIWGVVGHAVVIIFIFQYWGCLDRLIFGPHQRRSWHRTNIHILAKARAWLNMYLMNTIDPYRSSAKNLPLYLCLGYFDNVCIFLAPWKFWQKPLRTVRFFTYLRRIKTVFHFDCLTIEKVKVKFFMNEGCCETCF